MSARSRKRSIPKVPVVHVRLTQIVTDDERARCAARRVVSILVSSPESIGGAPADDLAARRAHHKRVARLEQLTVRPSTVSQTKR